MQLTEEISGDSIFGRVGTYVDIALVVSQLQKYYIPFSCACLIMMFSVCNFWFKARLFGLYIIYIWMYICIIFIWYDLRSWLGIKNQLFIYLFLQFRTLFFSFFSRQAHCAHYCSILVDVKRHKGLNYEGCLFGRDRLNNVRIFGIIIIIILSCLWRQTNRQTENILQENSKNQWTRLKLLYCSSRLGGTRLFLMINLLSLCVLHSFANVFIHSRN